jgi:transcriptional regulator with XRE-family HTH domain
MKKTPSILSKHTRLVLSVLGDMILTGRKQRNMSQSDLAERLGVSRYSVIAIEKGDPKVSIGTVFEAATIVGIPILSSDREELKGLANSILGLRSVLPQRSGRKKSKVNDDF